MVGYDPSLPEHADDPMLPGERVLHWLIKRIIWGLGFRYPKGLGFRAYIEDYLGFRV